VVSPASYAAMVAGTPYPSVRAGLLARPARRHEPGNGSDEGITALVATHDPALIDVADEVLLLEDGMLVPEQD
jgi:hypothetical protein